MELSIIIVNYNVKFFIEQCLYSVEKAIKNIQAEVFVVDNNSVDGSCELIKSKFGWVKLIENRDNPGFSIANNQAIRNSTGKYVLLLNPDTVVEETTFSKVLSFMNSHDDAGGLGVKMIDGKGQFLPESKRGVPTPMVAFFKMFGFSKLFPKSPLFNRYHLGFLDKEEVHEIEILSGAFMLLRKSVLDEIGLLDEDYFMYGEDIDLSYRILKAGYKNYYFPNTTIIHYKGESTKKGSVNYVLVFYKAMIIFAKKQLSSKHSKLLSFLINIAIFIRASIAIINRGVKKLLLPFLDSILIYIGFLILIQVWERFKFEDLNYYPVEYFIYIVPSYILIWLTSIFFSGGYDKPVKLKNGIKGVATGFLLILIVYALLDEDYRYSRALLLLGSVWTFIAIPLSRVLLHLSGIYDFKIKLKKSKKIVLVGDIYETTRVQSLLLNTGQEISIVGYVGLEKNSNSHYLGEISQINEIVKIHKIDEIIFCLKDISAEQIIAHMLKFTSLDVDFKIAPPETVSIIGSNSIHTTGDLYTLSINSIAKKQNKRKKRIFDIAFTFLVLVLSPLVILIVQNSIQFLKNALHVILGKKTWVTYNPEISRSNLNLPEIKDGIVYPANKDNTDKEIINKINIIYAKDYSSYNDLVILLKNFRYLGSKHN